jgi:hypothetical protein
VKNNSPLDESGQNNSVSETIDGRQQASPRKERHNTVTISGKVQHVPTSVINRVEYIHQVVVGLPGSVRNCLDESYMDWTTFIGKVKAINVSQLKVQANMEKSIQELNALVQNLNINRRTESQMVSPRPQQYRPVPQAVVTTPNRSNGTTPSNQFRANPYTTSPVRAFQPRAPTTETEKAEIQQRLLTYPHQVNTDAGQAVYQRQLAQWAAGRGSNDIVTRATPVPLRPGTAPVCSGECYRCGTHGHRAGQCPVPDGHGNKLSAEESRWRVVCTGALGQVNRATGNLVYLVGDDAAAWQEWDGGNQQGEAGNEDGSTV